MSSFSAPDLGAFLSFFRTFNQPRGIAGKLEIVHEGVGSLDLLDEEKS